MEAKSAGMCISARLADESVIQNRVLNELFIRFVQHVFAQADFDGKFPITGWADKNGICANFNRLARTTAQLLVAQLEPEHGMSIEQKPHGM
jgi:hypothetical protein